MIEIGENFKLVLLDGSAKAFWIFVIWFVCKTAQALILRPAAKAFGRQQ